MSEDEHQHQHCRGADGAHLSCREISEFLLAYTERELDSEVHSEFERHLQLCPPCGHYLDGYRETVELVRKCGRDEVDKSKHKPPPEDLVQAILKATAKAPSSSDSSSDSSGDLSSDG